MPMIVVMEPHTLYRLGIIRLLTDTLPEAKLLGMDYTSLDTGAGQQGCDLLLLSVPSAEASHTLLYNAKRALQPKAILLMIDTMYAFPDPYESVARVRGHLLKNASLELMTASINLVLAGGTCFPSPAIIVAIQAVTSHALSPSVVSAALNSALVKIFEPMSWTFEQVSCSPQTNEAHLLGITHRQYEVLVLLARGMTIKGIARELSISAATVKVHVETLYMRMDVHNRNEAISQAVSKGARLGHI